MANPLIAASPEELSRRARKANVTRRARREKAETARAEAGAASVPELLAALVGPANAARVMETAGGLRGLATLTSLPADLGETETAALRVAVELGRRLVMLGDGTRTAILSPADAAALLMADLRYAMQEEFRILILDSKNQLLKMETITVGTVNASLVHPREVFRPAILQPCAGIILAHNHPSGDPTPSREDLEVTKQLVAAGTVLGIPVLDHVVIGDGRFVSFQERGLM